jgi:hypothetical protein
MDYISYFMVLSHFVELGPIIAYLYVAGSSLYNNNTLSSYLLDGFGSLLDLRKLVSTTTAALATLASSRASGATGGSGTFSGIVPVCLFCSSSLISLSCTVLLSKTYVRNSFSRNTSFLATNTSHSVLW